MQSEDEAFDRIEVKLDAVVGKHHIPRFCELYALYLGGYRKSDAYVGGILIAAGAAIALLALLVLAFDPSAGRYSRSAGLFWLGYVRLYAAPLFMAGGALFTLGCHLYANKPVGPIDFLMSIYTLTPPEGQLSMDKLQIRYVGGDYFIITVDEKNLDTCAPEDRPPS
ncbi:hypothetical protein [Pseudomonas alabamensis]|uniref:hypothetical protein n=1 Tax=Pseudomonas alabamensis TaxID=3064349 RepID=UPI003F650679